MSFWAISPEGADLLLRTVLLAALVLAWGLGRERFWAGFTVVWRRLFGKPPSHHAAE
ncbi:MAG: hypothetical protein JNJ73_11845 [Hyphomonadaceae bacterium]|nr:hypothetical protein [Hyphomonadaceae bacterium]